MMLPKTPQFDYHPVKSLSSLLDARQTPWMQSWLRRGIFATLVAATGLIRPPVVALHRSAFPGQPILHCTSAPCRFATSTFRYQIQLQELPASSTPGGSRSIMALPARILNNHC
jgi:hypothetical protein